MNEIIGKATKEGFEHRISKHNDYEYLCESLDRPKVFVFSLPHGKAADSVLEGLEPYFDKGDIIIDCGNEHWENTERRQGKAIVKGIRYVGCGVSGGYQTVRRETCATTTGGRPRLIVQIYRGPSMCPGSDDETLNLILPLLRKVAAGDSKSRPCVGKVGTRRQDDTQ